MINRQVALTAENGGRSFLLLTGLIRRTIGTRYAISLEEERCKANVWMTFISINTFAPHEREVRKYIRRSAVKPSCINYVILPMSLAH